jgi:hypothetical protein
MDGPNGQTGRKKKKKKKEKKKWKYFIAALNGYSVVNYDLSSREREREREKERERERERVGPGIIFMTDLADP